MNTHSICVELQELSGKAHQSIFGLAHKRTASRRGLAILNRELSDPLLFDFARLLSDASL